MPSWQYTPLSSLPPQSTMRLQLVGASVRPPGSQCRCKVSQRYDNDDDDDNGGGVGEASRQQQQQQKIQGVAVGQG